MKKVLQITGVAVAGTMLVFFCTGAAFEISYQNRAYPGVMFLGDAAGGKNGAELTETVKTKTSSFSAITLRWGVNEWQIPLSDLGASYDTPETVNKILRWSRGGEMIEDWRKKIGKTDITPVLRYDRIKIDDATATIAAQINIPAKKSNAVPQIISTHR